MFVRTIHAVGRRARKVSQYRRLLFVVLFLTIALPHLFAQDQRATLSGTLLGPSGTPISGVRISLLLNGAATRRQTISEEDGSFILPLLAPGSYTLQAYRDGFAVVQISQIELEPGAHRNLQIKFQLKPIHEDVSVYSDTGHEVVTVGTTIDQHLVEDLPLMGGSFPALFLLTPGVVMMPSQETSANDHPFSFNGQPTNANYFTLDGISVNTDLSLSYSSSNTGQGGSFGQNAGYSALGTTMSFLPANSLAEIDIRTATYAPAYGRQAGGHIDMVSRSGTSELHGAVSELFRNSALDAKDWFTVGRKLPLHLNDFSGSLGGPLGPQLRNNWQNYFFFAYEGVHLDTPASLITYVPSLRLRANAPEDLKLYLNVFPLPTGPEKPGSGLALYNTNLSLPSQGDTFSLRVDSTIGSRFTGFAHYSYSPSSVTSTDTGWDLLATNVQVQAITVGGTRALGKNGVDTFRANYTWDRGTTDSILRGPDGEEISPNDSLFPGPSFASGSRDANYDFLGETYSLGDPQKNIARQVNVVDDLAFTLGSHAFSLGFDYLRSAFESVPVNNLLNVDFLSLQGVRSGYADYFFVTSQQSVCVAQMNLSLYVQDFWRLGNRLQLSYGVRWGLNPAPYPIDGQKLYSLTVTDISTMSLSNGDTPIFKTRYTIFAPRVGFSYALNEVSGHETVLHAGAGIFYSLGNSNSLEEAAAFPHMGKSTFFNAPFPGDAPFLPPPAMPSLDPPYVGQNLMGYTPNYIQPKLYQWSAGLEQSLSPTQHLSIAYVGSIGRNLYVQQQLANPNPNFTYYTVVFVNRSDAVSSYNALQLQYKHRLSSGLEALASYTWAHSLDDASMDISTFSNTALANLKTEHGSSDFDLRNSFGMALTYEIPQLNEKSRWSSVLGHWKFSALALARGAMPLDVAYKTSVGTDPDTARPDVVVNQPIYLNEPGLPHGKVLNPNAFAVPTELRQGTLVRNSIRGFPFWQIDLAVSRDIHLSNKVQMQWRGDFFNFLNHPNFGDPYPYLTYKNANGGLTPYASFGQSLSMLNSSLSGTGAQKEFQIGGARSVQLGFKILF